MNKDNTGVMIRRLIIGGQEVMRMTRGDSFSISGRIGTARIVVGFTTAEAAEDAWAGLVADALDQA